MSRGAELLRLGSKNAEIRRYSSEDGAKNVPQKSVGAIASDFEIEKSLCKERYQKEIEDGLKALNEQKVCLKLMELQVC